MKKEIATTENTAVANIGIDILQDAISGSGFENVRAEDMSIPYIKLLQDLSPQCKKATKVEGAEPGLFFNTVSNKVLTGPFGLIPCAFESKYVEWTEDGSGTGQFVATHDSSILASAKKDGWELHLENGNKLVQTAYHYVLIRENDGSLTRGVIPLAMTQLKYSKKWVTLMQSNLVKTATGFVTPPMYAYSYVAESKVETKGKNSWYSWSFSHPTPLTSEPTYKFAREFYRQVVAGSVKLDDASLQQEAQSQSSDATIPNASEHF